MLPVVLARPRRLRLTRFAITWEGTLTLLAPFLQNKSSSASSGLGQLPRSLRRAVGPATLMSLGEGCAKASQGQQLLQPLPQRTLLQGAYGQLGGQERLLGALHRLQQFLLIGSEEEGLLQASSHRHINAPGRAEDCPSD